LVIFMKKSITKESKALAALAIFWHNHGLLEAAVVVYLRQLYYPEGLTLPLKPASSTILLIESSRELATLVMLITSAIAVGENALQSFAYFLYMFGFWDIFYYVFLKVFLRLASINSDLGCAVFHSGTLGQSQCSRQLYVL